MWKCGQYVCFVINLSEVLASAEIFLMPHLCAFLTCLHYYTHFSIISVVFLEKGVSYFHALLLINVLCILLCFRLQHAEKAQQVAEEKCNRMKQEFAGKIEAWRQHITQLDSQWYFFFFLMVLTEELGCSLHRGSVLIWESCLRQKSPVLHIFVSSKSVVLNDTICVYAAIWQMLWNKSAVECQSGVSGWVAYLSFLDITSVLLICLFWQPENLRSLVGKVS